MKNAQQEEATSQSDFENLKATKTEEIKAGTAQVETKTQELASTDEKNAQSKQDIEDTRASLAADTEFLAEVKSKCEGMDAEYAERVKNRQMEISACGKALAFLSSDEAHDLFSKTLGFVQTRMTLHPKRRQLGASARIAAFTEVKKAIQDMVDKL